jgi:hypothetical protein
VVAVAQRRVEDEGKEKRKKHGIIGDDFFSRLFCLPETKNILLPGGNTTRD